MGNNSSTAYQFYAYTFRDYWLKMIPCILKKRKQKMYIMLISVKGISAHYCLYCISGGAYLIRAKYRTAFKILAASLAARS